MFRLVAPPVAKLTVKFVPPPMPDAGADPGTLYVVPVGTSRVLTVGVGEQFATLSGAIAASKDGDVIRVDAGTYINDTATVNTRITIVGVGGMVTLTENQPIPNEKGILVINNDVTIANVRFANAFVPEADGANGAGIRYQGGNLHLYNDIFTGNQNGILGSPVDGLATNTVTIDHSTFTDNGVDDPNSVGYGYTHNFYIGAIDKLVATNSVFEDASGVGHELKSRAYINDIENNIISDGTSQSSYSIDLPDGGADIINGNYIEQGPNSQNSAIIHFGGEGFPYANSNLSVTNNTIVNDLTSGNAIAVLNQTVLVAKVIGNVFEGITSQQIASGPVEANHNVDGNGNPLADSTSSQLLPTNFTVFTGTAAHTVTLGTSFSGVEGAAGKLTVHDLAGHVAVIGGSGGVAFDEAAGAGGSTITTLAGSTNSILFGGQDSISSNGTDTITGGTGNATVLVNGTASIASGNAANSYTVNGTAAIGGGGGSDVVSIGNGGHVAVTGRESYLAMTSLGGSFSVFANVAGSVEQANVTGGSLGVTSYSNALNFLTAGGLGQGSVIRLGIGSMNVRSHAADTIFCGSGNDMVQLAGGGQKVFAGTGSLAIWGMSIASGANAIVYGGAGDYSINGDTGNITFIGGAHASTIEDNLANIVVIGGAGHLTMVGGARDLITGGAGGLTLTDAGGNTIKTQAKSTNALTLNGSDMVQSWGTDTIDAGSANQSITVHGAASIVDAQGANIVALLGQDSLTATAGNESIAVGTGANVVITSAAFTSVTESVARVKYTATGNPTASSLTVIAGSASIVSAGGAPLTVTTKAGFHTEVDLGVGPSTVISAGVDTIKGGTGTDTITITSNGGTIIGGSGTLNVTNSDYTAGHNVTVRGGSGSFVYNDGGPSKLTFIGGTGSAIINGAWGILDVTAGSGATTVTGGTNGPLRFVAGAGADTVAVSALGGAIEFGSGTASVTEQGYGAADVFTFLAGHGGGIDMIANFRVGVDSFAFQGVSIKTQTVSGGSTMLTLSDNTHVQVVGVAHLGHVG